MTSVTSKRRVRLPISLMVLTATGCPSPIPPCGSDPADVCGPDGGYVCGDDCSVELGPDGGVTRFPTGSYECFC